MNRHLLLTLTLLAIKIVSYFNPQPLIASTPYQIKEPDDEPAISIDNENVRYAGQLTPDGLSRLKALTDHKKITSLTIKSGGGEISTGTDFGNWVFDNQLDVIVDQGCFSSCANYVFPAGRKKTILPGAVVAWHGSALQQSFQTEEGARKELERSYKREKKKVSKEQEEKDVKSLLANFTLYKEKQAAFYQKIGVDEYVTRIGQEEYGAKGFYFLSVEDMERFGIKNVTAPKDYAKMDLTQLRKRIKVPLVYIKLR
ncbi:MAG TPA: hypothetical protein VGN95_17920 [Pyrinomonadaceae bacterium]|nr:hypothetical protein [Pyrinomonadaceae bacterium]